ncbi:MAG TPA: hypothetical protein PKN04_03920 [bacterium]|nr:hypothetical protein [bacterium]HNT64905.1 hypothetical protein [bacterium]HOX84928.1 hypothetical protein [bacterium]HPG44206.1 hypothetical protein [bacterium]HPM96573.1 hypothetical protein [bacterium]
MPTGQKRFFKYSVILWAIGLNLWVIPGSGQSLSEALEFWRQGDLAAAADRLYRLTNGSADSLQAMVLLGKLETMRSNWSDGIGWLDRAERGGSDDLAVNFYRGICYRQRGRSKAVIWRRSDWNAAEKNFLQVIDRNPSYEQIWIEYGILHKDRQQYFTAVETAEKQLYYHPLQSDAEVYVNYLYEVLLKHENAEAWLAERSDLRSRFFLGQFYLSKGKIGLARDIFLQLLDNPASRLSAVPVFLALARIAAQQEDAAAVQQYADSALDTIRYEVDAAHYFDAIQTILTDDEFALYRSLTKIADKQAFFRRIWHIRNPLLGTSINYRLFEHFRRLLVAEKEYWYDGWRTWFNNPDKMGRLQFPAVFYLNQRFNDKGLVYLRHGEPHDRAIQVGANLPDNESWLYRADDRREKLMFHFVLDDNAVGNNWRITPNLPLSLYRSRQEWDAAFQISQVMSELDVLQSEEDIMRKSEASVTIGLNSDRHTWKRDLQPIEIANYIATFKSDSGRNRLECYIGLSLDAVFGDTFLDVVETPVHFEFIVSDTGGRSLFRQERRIDVAEMRKQHAQHGLWIGQMSLELPPQPLLISLHCRSPLAGRIGGYAIRYPQKNFDSGTVQLSDIVLAHSIAEREQAGEFVKNGLEIIPRPDRQFSRRQPIYLYYEIYHLPLDERGRANYELEYRVRSVGKQKRNLLAKITDLFSTNREKITNRVELDSRHTSVKDYLALDLSRLSAGSYELEIGVRLVGDENEISSRIPFILRDE